MSQTEQILEGTSFSKIQEMMDQLLGNQNFSFRDYVESLVAGKNPFRLEDFFRVVWNGVLSNIRQERQQYIMLILLAISGAVLMNFSKLMKEKQVAEVAFYIVYMLFFTMLASSFAIVSNIALTTLQQLLDFMKVLTPAYFMTMAFSTGAVVSGAYYEFTLVMITLANVLLLQFVIPGINLYFILLLSNKLTKEKMFSKMAELLQGFLYFIMKSLFTIMMGVNVIQGLILPVTAELKNATIIKMGNAIPGIGNTVGTITETVLCAGKLVKNAIGVTGVIVCIFICLLPLLRIGIGRLCYLLIGAFIQPISDERLVECLDGTAEAAKMLLYAVGTGSMMFVCSIAVVSAMVK